jgi:rhodanese-related sulfurtransferase
MRLALVLLVVAVVVAGGVWWWAGRAAHRPGSLAWRAVDRDLATRFSDVPTTTTAALAAQLADSTVAPLLLDARTEAEYAVSHLPGAHRVDPDASPAELADALEGIDRQRPIVVYCSVGVRSGAVARRLQSAGFGRVENLAGSIFRWANEGRPLVRDGRAAVAVHPYDAVWGRLLAPEHRAEVAD